MPHPEPGTPAFERAVQVAENDAKACELRQAGLSYRQIATQLGMSPSGAHEAVQRALAALRTSNVEEMRRVESERLDTLTRTALGVMAAQTPLVQQGRIVRDKDGVVVVDQGMKLAAVDRLIKIMDRRAKLFGLDAPVEQKVTISDVLDDRVTRAAAELDLMAQLAAVVEAGAADLAGGAQG